MRRSLGIFAIGFIATTAAACSGGGGEKSDSGQVQSSPLTSTSTLSAAASAPDRDMIVIMRDQMANLNPGRGTRRVRSSAIASAHAPLIANLQATKPRQVHSFEMANGFATKLSQSEIDQLSAQPQVLAVVPDRVIQRPKSSRRSDTAAGGGVKSANVAAADSLCNTLEPEALQLTNTAFLDTSKPQAQEVVDGNGVKVTGRGVTVGILADGLDTNIAGFTRPDGSKVFVDYQDFSGDPAGTPTAGGEMFGDASSIGAQDMPNGKVLNFDLSTFVSAAHPLPSPCNIRVRGVAPGASLVGLKVFSQLGTTTTSGFVQAIDYAVTHDDVDILNESFGGNSYPDDATDPISLANQAAVRSGVTVVVSTGDAGSNDTLGSPSTDNWVIASGATTSFRLYAQTNDGVYSLANGYVNGNLSSFSSGGFAQKGPRTVDLVAPGDLGWALCATNADLYQDCTDLNGNPAGVEIFGGTSESAPLTSGAAALVIQAYRSTHDGATPSPALVKRILMSTAADIGAPSDEQGAGFLDALKAVNTALSVRDENGAPAPRGAGLLATPTSARITANQGDDLVRTFEITNTSATAMKAQPAIETLGAPFAGATLTGALNPATDPTYSNVVGTPTPYTTLTFTVPAGADHLDAAIAWPSQVGGNAKLAALMLLDPSGRQVAYSNPQGVGSGYGHVDVVHPTAGKWTAVVRTSVPTNKASYTGNFQFTWGAEHFVSAGQVFPSRLWLPPGATAQVIAHLNAPNQPGDFAAALRLHGTNGVALSEIPVTVRTLVPIGRHGGSFTGTLTGGNGRAGANPASTYAFDVPEGLDDLALSLQFPDNGYALDAFLVDPNGMILSSGTNTDPNGAAQNAVQLFRVRPQAGRWRLVLQEIRSSGNQTSMPFNARIAFNQVDVSAAGLPSGAHTVLSASAAPVTVPVTVTNTGALAKAFFADARLATPATVTLPVNPCSAPTTPGYCGYLYVPPRVSRIKFIAQASAPITMDAFTYFGGTDLWAHRAGNGTIVASLSEPEIVFGLWGVSPSLVGPFGPGGEASVPVTTSAVLTMQPFDAAVSASSGNAWTDLTQGTTTYDPVVLAPGATGTITLTITPDPAQVGNTVKGVVYVDTLNTSDLNANLGAGDEVARLPYGYTIVK